MRGHPDHDASPSLYPRNTHDRTTQRHRPSRNAASTANAPYESSIGYRLATEGSYGDMGATGALQIWPKVSHQDQQPLLDTGREQRMPYYRSVSESASQKSRPGDDASTLHSFRNSPLSLSAKTSMSSFRDAPTPKVQYTIHPASSHPNFHFSKPDSKRREELGAPPKSSHSSRSQRLGLSKLFHSRDKEPKPSRDKEHKSSKDKDHRHAKEREDKLVETVRLDARMTERSQPDKELHRVRVSTRGTEPPPSPPAIIHRSHQTAFERNATENAKVNQRRPPKGIQHWFEGLDESDDDFPEVVQTPPEHVTPATFRPSLGPGRLRAAPTSRVSPAAEPAQDYFRFHASEHSGPQTNGNLQEHSMLNLSSSDDDEVSEPASPDGWPDRSLHNMEQTVRPSAAFQRTKSTDAGDSVFSMQTTMTSGSIPIINADSLYLTPLPPMPTNFADRRPQTQESSAMPAPLRTRSSEMVNRARAPTAQSIPNSVASDVSAATASTTHVMTVTQEEMVLLEMMRRKRAEMHSADSSSSPSSASRQESQPSSSARPRHFERQNSTSKSIASSTISCDSDRSILGTGFPAPPSAQNSIRVPSTERPRYFDAHSTDEKGLAYVKEEDDYKSKRFGAPSPDCHELEAPLEILSAATYSQPKSSEELQKQHDRRPRIDKKTGLPPPPYNSADPYSLAPDLNFSPLDLLPLPARTYSPSLSTSRSSVGESQSSALTPTDGNSSSAVPGPQSNAHGLGVSGVNIYGSGGLGVGGAEICELDVKRNSHVPPLPAQGAGNDVLAAWSALGGMS